MRIPLPSRSTTFSVAPTLVLFFAYWSIAAVTYGPSCADIPRRDDHWYMAERAWHPNPVEWFQHTLSFTRTRRLAPGDYFLCRPAHYAVLTSTDLAFRGQPRWYAGTSLLWLTLAALSLQVAIRPAVGWPLSILAGACFLCQYPAMEIVCWRHISPYLLSLACLGFGLAASRRSLFWAVGLWTLGCLFHECIAVTLLLTGVACSTLAWACRQRRHEAHPHTHMPTRAWACHPVLAMLLPVAIYALWNAVDFFQHRPATLAVTTSDPTPAVTLAAAWTSLTTVFNAAATAFVTPSKVQLVPHESGMLAWVFDPLARHQARAGAAVVSLIACFLPALFRQCAKGWPGLERGEAPAALHVTSRSTSLDARPGFRCAPAPATHFSNTFTMGLALLAAIVLALGLGRGLLRGPGYLHQATYYYAFTAYALVLVISGGVAGSQQGWSPAVRTVVRSAMALWLATMTVTGAVRNHATLAPDAERRATWAADHERVIQEVTARGGRLAGIVPGCEERLRPRISLLLLQEVRWRDPSKPSLYLGLSANGRPEVQFLALRDGRQLTAADRQLFRIEQHEAWVQIGETRHNVTVLGNHPPSSKPRLVRVGDQVALVDGEDVLTSVPVERFITTGGIPCR